MKIAIVIVLIIAAVCQVIGAIIRIKRNLR